MIGLARLSDNVRHSRLVSPRGRLSLLVGMMILSELAQTKNLFDWLAVNSPRRVNLVPGRLGFAMRDMYNLPCDILG